MRNSNPFTERQLRLLKAIHAKLKEINNPDPELITHDSFEWYIETTKQFRTIPKLRFKPGSTQKKSEIIVNAQLDNPERQEQLGEIRRKYGIKKARNTEASLFESEWNNIMLKAKKAAFTLALINQLFATKSQAVAVPVQLLQKIIADEYKGQIKTDKGPIPDKELPENAISGESEGIRPYDLQLADLE